MISLLFALIVCGVAVYCINAFIPMDPRFKTVVNIVIGLMLVFWVLQFLGLMGGAPAFGTHHVSFG